MKLSVRREKGPLAPELRKSFRDVRSLTAAQAAAARDVLAGAGLPASRIQTAGSPGVAGGREARVVEIELVGAATP